MQRDGAHPIDHKIRCPRDGVVMHKFRVGGSSVEAVDGEISADEEGVIVLDRCHVCRGFWVDLGELSEILQRSECIAKLAENHPPLEYEDETLDCPRCSTQLVRLAHHQQRHLQLDTCSVCGGIFFDAQELTDLSAFTLLERFRAFFD